MLSLAQNLVDRGCRITYVTATSTADEMLKLWPIKRTDPDASGRASRLRLVGIGSPVSHQGRTATEFIWKNIVMLVRGTTCVGHLNSALTYLVAEQALSSDVGRPTRRATDDGKWCSGLGLGSTDLFLLGYGHRHSIGVVKSNGGNLHDVVDGTDRELSCSGSQDARRARLRE